MNSDQLTPTSTSSSTCTSTSTTHRYIRAKAICTTPERPGLLPICSATLWRWVRKGAFPRPVRLSGGVTAWIESDITAWLAAQEQASAANEFSRLSSDPVKAVA